MGVHDIWVIDPESRRCYTCIAGKFEDFVGDTLRIARTEIHVPLALLWAELARQLLGRNLQRRNRFRSRLNHGRPPGFKVPLQFQNRLLKAVEAGRSHRVNPNGRRHHISRITLQMGVYLR